MLAERLTSLVPQHLQSVQIQYHFCFHFHIQSPNKLANRFCAVIIFEKIYCEQI